MTMTSIDEDIPEISFSVTSRGLSVACLYKAFDDFQAQSLAWQITHAIGYEMVIALTSQKCTISKVVQHENYKNHKVVFEVHTTAEEQLKKSIVSNTEQYYFKSVPSFEAEHSVDSSVSESIQDDEKDINESVLDSVLFGYFPLPKPSLSN